MFFVPLKNVRKPSMLRKCSLEHHAVFHSICELSGAQKFKPQSSFVASNKTPYSGMLRNGLVKISVVFCMARSRKWFTKSAPENIENTYQCPCRSSSPQKRSKIEHVNISLYHEHFHSSESRQIRRQLWLRVRNHFENNNQQTVN